MFRNDYGVFCADEVLEALYRVKNEENFGYGEDIHTKNAAKLIRLTFGLKEDAGVYFLSGGTQTNMAVISYYLRPYEAVICCDSGHINVHETGAVEASGHKILTCPNEDGKLTVAGIKDILAKHIDNHMVKPKMVYISDSTETGTIYSLKELKAIRKVCDENGLYLFIDGARLGTALTCVGNDVLPIELGAIADVFYVGGTKNGALFGEAVVINDPKLAPDFLYHIKNRGALLAKGFVAGVMFETLFDGGLYFRLALHANEMAKKIREGLREIGVRLYGNSPTNQIFIYVEKEKRNAVLQRFALEPWGEEGNEAILRIVTSYATKEKEVDELLAYFRNI
ncbi:MAG: aminotransferase class I/II-fold pyridoxal phosphate-dependent enzyme [Bacilli bacterium]|nr:aminotransferase class I/II-fold pyridoxal phosphate-dependent enzyme [Bacilli bacterium]